VVRDTERRRCAQRSVTFAVWSLSSIAHRFAVMEKGQREDRGSGTLA
jgi:hypothetical protein